MVSIKLLKGFLIFITTFIAVSCGTQHQATQPKPSPSSPDSFDHTSGVPSTNGKMGDPSSITIPKELASDPEKLKSIGESYLAAGNVAAALKYLKAAELRRPKDAQLLYEIAIAYSKRGFREQAKEYIQRALAVQPDYAEAVNALGAFLAEEGKFEEARRAFERALNNPYYETPQLAAYNLGSLFYRMGNYQEAARYYRQAIKLAPTYAAAHLELARTLEAIGNTTEALNEYKQALQYDPKLVQANFGYGKLLYEQKNYTAARYYFEQVIKLAPDTPTAKVALEYLKKIDSPGRKP